MRVGWLVLILVTWIWAAPIAFEHNFDVAKAKAQKEDKILYVLITSETCRWCRKLEETTLKDDSITNTLTQHFISIDVIRDKDQYPPCLKAPMVPTSYFLTPDGRILYSVPGYWSSEDYASILGDVIRKYKREKKAQTER